MNKLVKGSIAGAAGIILLMGGAGSLAYWNDSAAAGPAGGSNTITAGTLTVTAATAGTWSKSFYNAANAQVGSSTPVLNLSAVKVVPGNRLVFQQAFNIVGTGDDLWFTVGKTDGAVVAASGATADVNLASAINTSGVTAFAISSVTGGTVVPSTTSGVYKVSSNAGTAASVTVTWTINFPFGVAETTLLSTKTGAVTLNPGAITLTQVAAP